MINVDISIETPSWESACPDYESLVQKAIDAVFTQSPVARDLLQKGIEPDISVVLADDAAVQTLNRDYRNKDKPTNVLSFAQLDSEAGWIAPDQPGPCALGDLVLAYETVLRESQEGEKPFESHFIHLIVHGTLHLLGYDHIDDVEAETMESLEIQILKSMYIENPYKNLEIGA
ncbi:MAG: rRNA maturation RNase YbeY [Micavibrio sp.]